MIVRVGRALAVFLALGGRALGAQTVVSVQAPTSSVAARTLRQVLSSPHRVIVQPESAAIRLRRDTVYGSSVVVVGGTVRVASLVHGDVVVVGGDLFLHPGAVIEGRAVAIGGGVYSTALGRARDGTLAIRDEALVRDPSARGDSIVLRYHRVGPGDVPALQLPAFGARIPSYDRVNGASLGWGPIVSLDSGAISIDPRLVYRTNLGAIDPVIDARWNPRGALDLEAQVGRITATNDAWIRSTLMNSLATLVGGSDTRNYYRSDRAELRALLHRRFATSEIAPYVGVRTERDWSTGPNLTTAKHPWSLSERDDREDGMLRPNPAIAKGRITSVLLGSSLLWESGGIRLSASLDGESALSVNGEVPALAGAGALDLPSSRFSQLTTDVAIGFPTFGAQRISVDVHDVFTRGRGTPPQRYAYLGGSGTLPTIELLSMGGDRLFYVDSRYYIPIQRFALPFVGSPTLMLHHAMGSAGVDSLPHFVQNVGARVLVGFLQADFMYDPVSHEKKLGIGVTLGR